MILDYRRVNTGSKLRTYVTFILNILTKEQRDKNEVVITRASLMYQIDISRLKRGADTGIVIEASE